MAYDRYDREFRHRRRAEAPRGRYGRRPDWGDDIRDSAGPPADYDYAERDFFHRAGDEVMSWFGDEEAERRRRYDEMMDRRDRADRYAGGFRTRGSYGPRPFGGYGTDDGFGMTKLSRPVREHDYGAGYGPGYGDRDRYAEGYEAWRNRQMADYDRDYHEFRRENQERFDREFGEWREKRYRQRLAVGTVKEGQEVLGSDDEHVGRVDYIRGDRIILAKNDAEAGGHHHSIPSSWVEDVGDTVRLNCTAAEAQNRWRDIDKRKAMFESEYDSRPEFEIRSMAHYDH